VARAARLAAANDRLLGSRAAADERAAAVAAVAVVAAVPAETAGVVEGGGEDDVVDVAVDLSFAVTCRIRWDEPLKVLLMPCKHVALCQQCVAYARVARCPGPVCSVDIQHRLQCMCSRETHGRLSVHGGGAGSRGGASGCAHHIKMAFYKYLNARHTRLAC